MSSRTELKSWLELKRLANQTKNSHMKEQFKVETDRATRFSLHMPEIFLDYSKNRINQTVFDTLVNLAKETELETWRNNMFSGEQINRTEQRSLLGTDKLTFEAIKL